MPYSLFGTSRHRRLILCTPDQETGSFDLTAVCVTCGGVDSPEWRKVRLDFKASTSLSNTGLASRTQDTLQLRWAKQSKRIDDANEGGGANTAV